MLCIANHCNNIDHNLHIYAHEYIKIVHKLNSRESYCDTAFENRTWRIAVGSVREVLTGGLREFCNDELHNCNLQKLLLLW